MRRHKKTLIVIAATGSMLLTPGFVGAKSTVDVGEMTRRASDLSSQGKLQDALELETKAAKMKPKSWLAHAALAYLLSRAMRLPEAFAEAQMAARLAPRQLLPQTNLAQLQYLNGQFSDAAQTYQRDKQLVPTDWLFGIGLAQTYLRTGRDAEGLAILHGMATHSNNSFDWYYHVGETCIQLNELTIAQEAARNAFSRATTAEQKSASIDQLFLALILDNQLDRARSMMDEVFHQYKPLQPEIYVRAASTLLPVIDPASGKNLLRAAAAAMQSKEYSDVFYRLGRVFEDKADFMSYDATKRSAWNDSAAEAYDRAIALNPYEAKYFFALAGILDRQRKTSQMLEELKKASVSSHWNKLASYLISKTSPSSGDTASGNFGSPGAQSRAYALNLTEVVFDLNGVSCSCKLSSFERVLNNLGGVAFEAIVRNQPFQATVLVDQSVTPVEEIFAQVKKCPEYPGVTCKMISSKPVTSAADAIAIAQRLNEGGYLTFERTVSPFWPVMPVELASKDKGSHLN